MYVDKDTIMKKMNKTIYEFKEQLQDGHQR